MTQVSRVPLTVHTHSIYREQQLPMKFSVKCPTNASFNSIGQAFQSMHRIALRQDLKAVLLDSNTHPLTPVVLGVLFPGTSICRLIAIHNMPGRTLEEMIDKENAYRNLILNSFNLKEVVADRNSALRAVISSINPEINPNSEEMTAVILRGDLIEHVDSHPQKFDELFNDSKADFDQWQSRIAGSEASIGVFELEIMCDFLERSIHVYSYLNPCLGENGEISPSERGRLGASFEKRPLNLYFDPIRNHYRPMFAR